MRTSCISQHFLQVMCTDREALSVSSDNGYFVPHSGQMIVIVFILTP
jgi:hypothetical protein